MARKVIHFGWDDCYRIQVLRYAGYHVDDCRSLENLAKDLQRDPPVHLVVISEDDWRDLPQAAEVARCYTTAPLILFRRTQHRVDESMFDRVFSCLAPPDVWLSQIAELIETRESPNRQPERSGLQTQTGTLLAPAPPEEENSSSIACVFDQVRISGRDQIYLIVRINPDNSSADLVQLTGKFEVERGVSIATLVRAGDRSQSS